MKEVINILNDLFWFAKYELFDEDITFHNLRRGYYAYDSPESGMDIDNLFIEVKSQMEAEQVETLEDLCDYILEHADKIYVRERNEEGHWDSLALTDLESRKAIEHALRFIKEGIIPVRVTEEKE